MSARLLAVLMLVLAPLTPVARAEIDPALADRDWLREVIRYTYYWYLDDAFFGATQADTTIDVWVRGVEPHQRDPEDRSRFAELWLPQAKVLLGLKQADYHIPELDLPVKSAGYRVIRGSHEETPPGDPAAWQRVAFDRAALFEELRSTRGNLHAPRPATQALAVAAMRREFARAGDVKGPQQLFIAARTDVTTDVWVFWLDRRLLVRISGDMDAVDPGLAAHLPLLVRRYPLGENVVASFHEAEGRNSFLTRDLASRALFVCLARGEAVVLEP
ncbi:hypothetical protein Verru16b_00692 [Lacunisphaera limnophila]|uniref:Uncharacterized protein n=1 Tax=Lacunisphaera limnophila TaxID=1838286 RepID=A0A1D8ARZ2_9BACT|nr:hypothetical protein [Lacunisphaera limnophila]AOS43640.1 hypothetical protein Verru16b_00692 [Lacunisphaera limnophila]